MTDAPPRSYRLVWILGIVTLIAFLIVFLIWLFIWRLEETTNDAYVNGNQVIVTPQISGYIQSVFVEDTSQVQQGDLLVTLDPTDMTIALEKAKQNLALSVRNYIALQERVETLKADKQVKTADLYRTSQDFVHRGKLIDSGSVSVEDYEHAEAAFMGASASLMMVEHELKSAIAQIENTTLETHPQILESKAALREAFVKLKRCQIYAPVHGMVGQKKAQVGEAVMAEDPLLVIVPFDQIWVDANFKEVQLKKVKVGQSVRIRSDFYGREFIFHGTVVGLNAATGSVFSLLPPQNATGNWIKIVQRLPVRIALDPEEIKKHPLRLGLSMTVTVDLTSTPQEPPERTLPLFETAIFSEQLVGVDELIDQIIKDNSWKSGY